MTRRIFFGLIFILDMVSYFKKKQQSNILKTLMPRIGGALLVVMIILLIVADVRMYQKREKLNAQIETLKNKIEDIKNQNAILKEGISNTNNNQYTEKIAREELNMQKPGEKVFSFIKEQNQEQQNTNTKKNIFESWFAWINSWFKK